MQTHKALQPIDQKWIEPFKCATQEKIYSSNEARYKNLY